MSTTLPMVSLSLRAMPPPDRLPGYLKVLRRRPPPAFLITHMRFRENLCLRSSRRLEGETAQLAERLAGTRLDEDGNGVHRNGPSEQAGQPGLERRLQARALFRAEPRRERHVEAELLHHVRVAPAREQHPLPRRERP